MSFLSGNPHLSTMFFGQIKNACTLWNGIESIPLCFILRFVNSTIRTEISVVAFQWICVLCGHTREFAYCKFHGISFTNREREAESFGVCIAIDVVCFISLFL